MPESCECQPSEEPDGGPREIEETQHVVARSHGPLHGLLWVHPREIKLAVACFPLIGDEFSHTYARTALVGEASPSWAPEQIIEWEAVEETFVSCLIHLFGPSDDLVDILANVAAGSRRQPAGLHRATSPHQASKAPTRHERCSKERRRCHHGRLSRWRRNFHGRLV